MFKDDKIRIGMFAVLIVAAILSIQAIINMNIARERMTSVAQVTDISDAQLSGYAGFSDVAEARLCINSAPIIDYDCNLTDHVFNRSKEYVCTINATDPNGDSVTFYSEWLTIPEMFNITPQGDIDFIPPRDSMGKQNAFIIHAVDSSGCSNNDTPKEFSTTVIGENRAPYLSTNMPNQQIIKDKYALITSLNDFFTDPDGDPLSYFFILQSGSTAKISISGSQVLIKGLSCGTSTAYFVAVDPFGLTAKGNTVSYEVLCVDNTAPVSSGSSQNTGGGGGGENQVCNPRWKCSAWSACQMGNFTYRRCIDYNGCEEPYDHYMFENCTYNSAVRCSENWECNEWSICENNIHTRMCLDNAACGTNKTKPTEIEQCNLLASCFDGLQDGNETGIDCGGECGACKNVEKPSIVRGIGIITIISSVLILGMGGLLLFTFRSRIFAAYMRMRGKKLRIKRKTYINNKEKEKLLQSLNIAQARLDERKEHSISYAVDELSEFNKEYFKQLLSAEKLPEKSLAKKPPIDNIDTIDRKEFVARVVKLKNKNLEKILVMLYAKMSGISRIKDISNKDSDDKQSRNDSQSKDDAQLKNAAQSKELEVEALIDELSHDIFLVAEFSGQDAYDSVKDRTIESKEHIDILYNRLSKIYIALKFGELIAAKNAYRELLKDYEIVHSSLSKLNSSLTKTNSSFANAHANPDANSNLTKDDLKIYNDIVRAFHAIKYLEDEYNQ